jgi:hypothetical protein
MFITAYAAKNPYTVFLCRTGAEIPSLEGPVVTPYSGLSILLTRQCVTVLERFENELS